MERNDIFKAPSMNHSELRNREQLKMLRMDAALRGVGAQFGKQALATNNSPPESISSELDQLVKLTRMESCGPLRKHSPRSDACNTIGITKAARVSSPTIPQNNAPLCWHVSFALVPADSLFHDGRGGQRNTLSDPRSIGTWSFLDKLPDLEIADDFSSTDLSSSNLEMFNEPLTLSWDGSEATN